MHEHLSQRRSKPFEGRLRYATTIGEVECRPIHPRDRIRATRGVAGDAIQVDVADSKPERVRVQLPVCPEAVPDLRVLTPFAFVDLVERALGDFQDGHRDRADV